MRAQRLTILSVMALSACVSFSGLDPASNYAEIGDSSVIVLGVTPRYRVHIYEGERAGDKWNRDQVMTKLNVYPEDGYIVAKVPARSGALNYGIGGILPNGIGGGLFTPCLGKSTITFDAPKGKVVYVGDVKLTSTGQTVRYEASSNPEAAMTHIKARFPRLAGQVVVGGFQLRELANTPCVQEPGGPIIIYIPPMTR